MAKRRELRAAWAGAVAATSLTGLLAGSVFVLAQVFEDEETPAARSPTTRPAPTPATTPAAKAEWADTRATVIAVRVGKKNPRAVVMVVALPTGAPGCARNLHAAVTQETTSTLDVRAGLQTLRRSCQVISRTIATTARLPLGARTVVVNGESWAPAGNGGYRRMNAAG